MGHKESDTTELLMFSLSLQKSDDVTSGEKGVGITLAPSMMWLTTPSHWLLPSLALCCSYIVLCGQK